MDWFDLPHGRKRWRSFANAVMNLQIPYNEECSDCLRTYQLLKENLIHGVT
jgi:hypothetical protein